MTLRNDKPYRKVICCVVLSCLTMLGCNRHASLSESFETLAEADSLPDSWELRSQSGTYRSATTGDAQEGRIALAVAGTGGEAELVGVPVEVASGAALLGSVWVKPKAFVGGTAFIGLVNPQAVTSRAQGLTQIPIDTQEWRQHRFSYVSGLDEAPVNMRFCVKLTGEGLLSIDNLQQSIHEIETAYQFNDGSFETPKPGAACFEWRVVSEKPGAAAKAYSSSKSPAVDGSQSLRLQGNGSWSVASWKSDIPASSGKVLLQGFARAVKGEARLKIEYYRGTERLKDSLSSAVSSNMWQPLSVATDAERLQEADTLRISLVAERGSSRGGTVVYFDKLQVLVIKP